MKINRSPANRLRTLGFCGMLPAGNLVATAGSSEARIEHVLGYIGQRRNAAAIGLINLIYNLARYEQIVRLKLFPLRAA